MQEYIAAAVSFLIVVAIAVLILLRVDGLRGKPTGEKTKDFFRYRASLLRGWWECRTKRCDYFQVYQGLGPAELTHVGYHAAERMALEHRANCEVRTERECETCKTWAERLRGELWEAIMGTRSVIADRVIEGKKRTYGFYSEWLVEPQREDRSADE